MKNLERETVSNGKMKDRVQLERDVLVLIELSRVKQVMRDIPRTLCNSVQYNLYIYIEGPEGSCQHRIYSTHAAPTD